MNGVEKEPKPEESPLSLRRRIEARLPEWNRIERFVALVLLGQLVLMLLVTGIALLSYYYPTKQYNYHDMKYLEFDVPFGMLMRNMHRHFSAYLLLFFGIHCLWRLLSQMISRRSPRWSWWRWVAGAGLVCAVAGLPVSGSFMPWDHQSIWGVSVGTDLAREHPLSGNEGPFGDLNGTNQRYDARSLLTAGRLVGGATITRFLFLHCVTLPLMATAFFVIFVWHRQRQRTEGPRDRK